MSKKVPIITIDGPSGVGKGTLSHLLAKHLNWHFLDSGAIYRVLAFAALAENISHRDDIALVQAAKSLSVMFTANEVWLAGQNISADIRSEACGNMASLIAVSQNVRQALLDKQRDFVKFPGLIADGRDMGTVVFPLADIKFFLDATARIRAERRFLQLKVAHPSVTLDGILQDIEERDWRDRTRAVAPLAPAEDALVIDTSAMGAEDVFAFVKKVIKERLGVY